MDVAFSSQDLTHPDTRCSLLPELLNDPENIKTPYGPLQFRPIPEGYLAKDVYDKYGALVTNPLQRRFELAKLLTQLAIDEAIQPGVLELWKSSVGVNGQIRTNTTTDGTRHEEAAP